MTVQFSFDADAYCRKAAERHARLMNPPRKKTAPTAAPVVEQLPQVRKKPNWYAEPKPYRAHIDAYKKSSRFAKTPRAYMERRALELGFTRKEITGHHVFGPFVTARRLIAYELSARFGMTPLQIGRLLKRDHSSIYQTFTHPKPTEEEASMRLVLPVGKTYMIALEQAYYDGVQRTEIAKLFRLTSVSLRKVANRLEWKVQPPPAAKPRRRKRASQ